MITPAGRRAALDSVTRRGVSIRAACRYLGLSRRIAHYELRQPAKDRDLAERLMATAQHYPRFGYRRSAAWLDESLCRVATPVETTGPESPEAKAKGASVWERHAAAERGCAQSRLEL